MSAYTEGSNADVATFRQIQFDDKHKDARGNKVFRRLGYDYVEYDGNTAHVVSGWEPVDMTTLNEIVSSGGLTAEDSSKHATSIAFVSADQMFTKVGVGGEALGAFPKG